MAEPDVTQIVSGPGLIKVAPMGTTVPVYDATTGENPIVWDAAWKDVGYTDAGIDAVYTPSIKQINVDEEASPVGDLLESEKYEVSAALAEATLANLNRAISASSFTDDTSTKKTIIVGIGSKPLNYVMVAVVGPAPGTNLTRVIIIRKAICTSAVSMKITRKDKVTIPVKFDARKLSGQDLVTIFDLTVGAV